MSTTLEKNRITGLSEPGIQPEPIQKGLRKPTRKKGGAGAPHVPRGRDILVTRKTFKTKKRKVNITQESEKKK